MLALRKIIFAIFITLGLLLSVQPLVAETYSHPQVERLLAADEAPDGVVFEVLSWDSKTWTWAAPMIRDLRKQLRERYPDLDIAVVSHGAEQFQLTQDAASKQPSAIETLSDLNQDGVNIHVCGVHSSWEDVSEDSYIDIVDVSPSGPAQINDYVNLGYSKVLITRPR